MFFQQNKSSGGGKKRRQEVKWGHKDKSGGNWLLLLNGHKWNMDLVFRA